MQTSLARIFHGVAFASKKLAQPRITVRTFSTSWRSSTASASTASSTKQPGSENYFTDVYNRKFELSVKEFLRGNSRISPKEVLGLVQELVTKNQITKDIEEELWQRTEHIILQNLQYLTPIELESAIIFVNNSNKGSQGFFNAVSEKFLEILLTTDHYERRLNTFIRIFVVLSGQANIEGQALSGILAFLQQRLAEGSFNGIMGANEIHFLFRALGNLNLRSGGGLMWRESLVSRDGEGVFVKLLSYVNDSINNLTLDQIASILNTISSLKMDDTEKLNWARLEDKIQEQLSDLTPDTAIALANGLAYVRGKGSNQTWNALASFTVDLLDKLSINQVSFIALAFANAERGSSKFWEIIEAYVSQNKEGISSVALCNFVGAFQYTEGGRWLLWETLNSLLRDKINKMEYFEIRNLVLSYPASLDKELNDRIVNRVADFYNQLDDYGRCEIFHLIKNAEKMTPIIDEKFKKYEDTQPEDYLSVESEDYFDVNHLTKDFTKMFTQQTIFGFEN